MPTNLANIKLTSRALRKHKQTYFYFLTVQLAWVLLLKKSSALEVLLKSLRNLIP